MRLVRQGRPHRPDRARAWGAALAVTLLVAAACGQKPGVATQGLREAAAAAGSSADAFGGDAELDAGGGTGATESASDSADAASMGSTSNTSETSAPGSTTRATGGRGSATSRSGAPLGGDTTGVTSDTITIGIHVPMTGAAPVPSASFDKGKDLYWRWLDQNDASIGGRSVRVVARNDNFNASQAVSVCKEMVEKDHVFMLVGFSGADEVVACARYAASVGVPYLSGGSTQAGLEDLTNYFAIWESYEQAAPLLADLVTARLDGAHSVNGMVRYSSPNLDEPHDRFVAAMEKRGAHVQYDRVVRSEANYADAQAIATELQQNHVKNVYMLVSPLFWIQVARAAAQQNYFPKWIGLYEAVEDLIAPGCQQNAIDGAEFLNMVPAYADADRFDPDFRKAGGSDGVQWILWGLSKAIAGMLALPGHDLTRERFEYLAARAGRIHSGVVPDLSFSPRNHFGGTALHLLRADCSKGHWVTEKAFATHF